MTSPKVANVKQKKDAPLDWKLLRTMVAAVLRREWSFLLVLLAVGGLALWSRERVFIGLLAVFALLLALLLLIARDVLNDVGDYFKDEP